MSQEPNDADLRERFAALRREEAARVSPFAVPRPRPSPLRRLPAWAAAAAATIAAVGTLWVLSRSGPPAGDRLAWDLATTAWPAPTDFLLETPGRDLLRAVPAIGVADAAPAPDTLVEERRDRR